MAKTTTTTTTSEAQERYFAVALAASQQTAQRRVSAAEQRLIEAREALRCAEREYGDAQLAFAADNETAEAVRAGHRLSVEDIDPEMAEVIFAAAGLPSEPAALVNA
jgi:hypothetical protein